VLLTSFSSVAGVLLDGYSVEAGDALHQGLPERRQGVNCCQKIGAAFRELLNGF
jgi:hypothetical protein